MDTDDKDAFKPVEERTLLEVGSDSTDARVPDDTSVKMRLGQVLLTKELGHGGMGKVYRGRHIGLDVAVAVKTMGAHIAGDATARQRFLREARTAARLDHPNIVRVLDVNEQDNVPYIVMEYVDGTDLSALLKQHGALDGMAVLKVIAQVADGLAHAHAANIVHRDIKPHNVFVSRDGRVKLGDFGLARAVEATTELTMPGAAIGTAHYMSPEQAGGHELDQRSDIYSLGVTAWHLITGAPPYKGTTPVSIAVQHVNSDIPYERDKFGHIPDAAVYLLISMTSREPARRPGAREVCDRLTQIVAQSGGTTRLASLDELLKHGSASEYVPAAPTPPPPGAPQFQFSAPHAPMPTPMPLPAHVASSDMNNMLLWIALGLVAFVLLTIGGCAVFLAMS
ncbi:MAG: serine/threonine protein kinase [Planctomycetes bacterium]|nr:serine/threonine protein kinase [Planctomycetota bacterium]MCW8135347.1 serine/threonine protein kinase [Planctomycetota bacterium]